MQKFRSPLEAKTHKLLKEAGLEFDYEPIKVVLQPAFLYSSWEEKPKKTVLPITYTPDFVDKKGRWVIETKGHKTQDFILKWKMFKHLLYHKKLDVMLFMPRNIKQVLRCIEMIKDESQDKRVLRKSQNLQQLAGKHKQSPPIQNEDGRTRTKRRQKLLQDRIGSGLSTN